MQRLETYLWLAKQWHVCWPLNNHSLQMWWEKKHHRTWILQRIGYKRKNASSAKNKKESEARAYPESPKLDSWSFRIQDNCMNEQTYSCTCEFSFVYRQYNRGQAQAVMRKLTLTVVIFQWNPSYCPENPLLPSFFLFLLSFFHFLFTFSLSGLRDKVVAQAL